MSNVQTEPERKALLEQVFRDHATRIYNLARRMLDHLQDAEDLTQEVLLKVFRELEHFRGEGALGTWIYRITVNATLKYRALRGRQPLTVGDPFEAFGADGRHSRPVQPWDANPEQVVLDYEKRQIIKRAIAGLPDTYRDVYLLTDVEQLPIPEVASLLDLTVPALKSRLHRARLLLRNRLAPYFEKTDA